ncbi:beta-ketoacyl-[acyl-carrier-protein] synthase family protein [Streptomyces durbertensis]|uniref:Beta-ketoacyl-[acyl-carrier-protein] synthase family protein n=1 Tax=Streptomyces durbertensis TaxID=2448886 RepID=A0ABR6EET3_9ACTN|nr:beta-ketoacyl-[acyl-carrier-protein] synthase family protein [Streptomyces durbertensis]MBB1243673.1 beta-ketoacyl-[acyl-carrier-protein] synthase family protein [Streptomyces durbertensis]
MTEEIVVSGIGMVTASGAGAEPTWDAVCSGLPTAKNDPALEGLPVDLSSRARLPDAGRGAAWRHDRATRLLSTAAREALRSAALDTADWDPAAVAVVIGTAAGGIATLETQHGKLLTGGHRALSPMTLPSFLPNMAAGHLALELGVTGPSLQTSTACASGATALITACLLLRSGACDIAVAGGTDAMATPLCVAAFAKLGALSRRTGEPDAASRPFDRDRDGFVLGEGSGVLVLERRAHCIARRGRPLAVLAGAGATGDAHHPTAPHPAGAGLRAATRIALAQAGAAPDDVDHVNAHGTSTRLNDAVEAAVIRDLYARRPPTVTSAKGSLGHTMGAAGAIEAALTVLSISRGTAPPTANHTAPDADTSGIDVVAGTARAQTIHLALSHSLGFGGHNTVLTLTAP